MYLQLLVLLQLAHVSQCLDGGWSVWLSWGPCTATVLGDVRSRDRQCDNPPASALGKDCQGPQTERSRCPTHTTTTPTIDGAWSIWSSWSTCTATCNGGLQSRFRTCTNPTASKTGLECRGHDFMQQLCNIAHCPVTNGAWANWSSWGTCTATCNGGLQSRSRTCSNPRPSHFGLPCQGNDVDKQLCNNRNCPERMVGFSVYASHSTLTSESTPTFTTAELNTGSYNMATGKFSCPVAGLYSFSLTLRVDSSDVNAVYCYFRVNGYGKASVWSYHDAYGSSSGTMMVFLTVGDVVDLGCYGWEHEYHSVGSSFSGVLIGRR